MRCKWFNVCPLRKLEKESKISLKWKDKYCSKNYPDCIRFKMEEEGRPHEDNLMPDGSKVKI